MKMKVVVAAVLLLMVVCEMEAKQWTGGFVKSTSIKMDNLKYLSQLKALNVSHVRVYATWKSVEPSLPFPLPPLDLAVLRNTSDQWLPQYSAQVDWTSLDNYVTTLVKNGIEPLIEIGEGTNWCLPAFNGGIADPASLSPDQYLAYLYRYSRAVVHRYKNDVSLWQIENELNEAFLESLIAIRTPRSLLPSGTPWGNWTFVTEILSTLSEAVRDESPNLFVTQNLHTDVPEHIHQLLHLPGFYVDAVKDWYSLMDVVSFDTYPNYIVANPLYPQTLSNRTSSILLALSQVNASYSSVMCAETGYPIATNYSTVPKTVAYSPTGQAQYMQQAFTDLVQAGGMGFQVFGMWPNSGFPEPPGGYTTQDIRALQAFNDVYQSGSLLPAISWFLLPPGTPVEHLEYALTRLPQVVGLVEQGWGILDPQGNPLPAYTALQSLYSSTN